MKKLMGSAVILLPLVVLMVLLVSGAVLGMLTHIYVEALEFVQPDTVVLIMDDESAPPTYKAEVNVLPLNATNQKLTYTSDDASVVTVDANGQVKAVGYGETYIRVRSVENEAASISKKVLVTDTKVHKILFNEYPTTMYEGESATLTVSLYPKEAENQLVEWFSSNPEVLTVNQNGMVTALGEGTVTVTAQLNENPNVKASVEITCHKELVAIDFDSSVEIIVEHTAKFPAVSLIPTDVFARVVYSSSNTDIATIDQQGNITFKQAGIVDFTVTATDFSGKTVQGQKQYSCTFGYYTGALFNSTSATFDFDEYYLKGKNLPIEITPNPKGSYREIIEVVFNPQGVISFDKNSQTFAVTGDKPVDTNDVTITLRARKYSATDGKLIETNSDVFRVTFTRNVKSIEFVGDSVHDNAMLTSNNYVNLAAVYDDSVSANSVNVRVTPASHTNEIKYEITEYSGSVAPTITSQGLLHFNSNGHAVVRVYAVDGNGEEQASASLTVTRVKAEGKTVQIGGQVTSASLALALNDVDEQTAQIVFTRPSGAKEVTYQIVDGDDVIQLVDEDEFKSIKPLKGGFATVIITVTFDDTTATDTYTINVYIDKSVSTSDVNFDFENGFVTSLSSYEFAVSVADNDGSLAGKKLTVSVTSGSAQASQSPFIFNGLLEFTAENQRLRVTAKLVYTDDVQQFGFSGEHISVACDMISTFGTLREAPTVTANGVALQTDAVNEFVLEDIGETLVFTVGDSFVPADFVLSEHLPVLNGTAYFNSTVSQDGKQIIIKATNGGTATVQLTISNIQYDIKVTVKVKANQIAVSYGNTKFVSGNGEYFTLLDKIDFTVTLSRLDNRSDITNKQVMWRIDGGQWATVDVVNGKVTVDLGYDASKVYFKSADGGTNEFEINLKKISQVEFFTLTASYTSTQEGAKKLETYTVSGGGSAINYTFPRNMQDRITFIIGLGDNLLGGVGNNEKFQTLFSIDGLQDWAVSYDATSATIVVTPSVTKFNQSLDIHHGNITQTVIVTRVAIQSIEFNGYDIGKKDDVYLGYQQVRVFAKHSYYDGKQVDYYKIPLSVTTNIGAASQEDYQSLNWVLTRVVGGNQQVITSQSGTTVTYNGKAYSIIKGTKGYYLQEVGGNVVTDENGQNSGGITWVDVFSEPGYARIYFGSFAGLSESDVQNDYFGDFGESGYKYTQATDDGSGRTFAPSANAGAFLRVEANDGVSESTVSRHYNFNVLNNMALVNVFDAAGYLAYPGGSVVLQNNLYGPGERDDVDSKLVLDPALSEYSINESNGLVYLNVSTLNKSIIYGNGYQVNFDKFNTRAYEACKAEGQEVSWNHYLNIGQAYNVTLKGRNIVSEITKDNYRLNIGVGATYNYYFYCDIQGWRIGLDLGGNRKDYLKNTVVRYCADYGIVMNGDNTQAYLENIVIVESVRAICSGSDSSLYYFKGFVDCLSYFNTSGLLKAIASSVVDAVGSSTVKSLMDSTLLEMNEYTEWFGQDGGKHADDTRYFNLVLLNQYSGGSTRKHYLWNNSSNSYELTSGGSESGALKTLATKKSIISALNVDLAAWSYNYKNSVDGGSVTYKKELFKTTDTSTRDMSKLFSDDRYIRLLCQFKSAGVANTDHIQWHMNRIYRDSSLVGTNGWHYSDHISNLKQSLADTEWGKYA